MGFVSDAAFQDIGTPARPVADVADAGGGATAGPDRPLWGRNVSRSRVGNGRPLGVVGQRHGRRGRRDSTSASSPTASTIPAGRAFAKRAIVRVDQGVGCRANACVGDLRRRRSRAIPIDSMAEHRMDPRQTDGWTSRERIDGYLQRSGLAARSPRVVPLTGDASDRRYFRVILPDAPSIVLALYSAAFDVRSLPFVNVATLLATDAGADPRRARTRRRSGRARAAGPRRRHAAGASRRGDAGGACGALPTGCRADRRRCSTAAPNWPLPTICPTASPSTWRSSPGSWSSSPSTSSRPIAASTLAAAEREALRDEFAAIVARARVGAARPLPPRLSQPQPDAARVAALHHRLPGCAARTRHLRSGLAAARLVCRSARADGRRADRVLPGAEGGSPEPSAISAAAST